MDENDRAKIPAVCWNRETDFKYRLHSTQLSFSASDMWDTLPHELWVLICDRLTDKRDLIALKLTCKAVCTNTPSWQQVVAHRMSRYVFPITLSLRKLISCKPVVKAFMHATATELAAMKAGIFAKTEPVMAIFMQTLCKYGANISNAQLAIRIMKKIVALDREAQQSREYQIYVLTYLYSTRKACSCTDRCTCNNDERKQRKQAYNDAKKIVPRTTEDDCEKYRAKMHNGYMVQMLRFVCDGNDT